MPGIDFSGPRSRLVAVLALPLAILLVGAVHLVRLATEDPPADPAGRPSSPVTTTASASKSAKGRPPAPSRVAADVAGVSLDNSTPASDSCLTFTNARFSVPVQVIGVVLDGAPKFIVVSDAPCLVPDLLGHRFRSCRGATLKPDGAGCDVGVGVGRGGPPLSAGGPDSVQHTGTVRLKLRATCTSRAGQPCRALGERYSPSRAAPIEVTWTDPGRERSVTVRDTSLVEPSSTVDATPGAGPEPDVSVTP